MSNGSHEVQPFRIGNIGFAPKRKKSRWNAIIAVGIALITSITATFITYLGLIVGGVSANLVALGAFGGSVLLFSAAGIGLVFGAFMLLSLLVAFASVVIIQSRDTKAFEKQYGAYAESIYARSRDIEGHIRNLASTFAVHFGSKDLETVVRDLHVKLAGIHSALETLKSELVDMGLVEEEASSRITSWEALADYLRIQQDKSNALLEVDEERHSMSATVILPEEVQNLSAGSASLFASGFTSSSLSMGLPASDALTASEAFEGSGSAEDENDAEEDVPTSCNAGT